MSDEFANHGYCIAATLSGADSVFVTGATCYLVNGSPKETWQKFVWLGRSPKKDRMVEKWCPTNRFTDFKAVWIPRLIRGRYTRLKFSGSKEEMTQLAQKLNRYAEQLKGA